MAKMVTASPGESLRVGDTMEGSVSEPPERSTRTAASRASASIGSCLDFSTWAKWHCRKMIPVFTDTATCSKRSPLPDHSCFPMADVVGKHLLCRATGLQALAMT